MNRIDDYDCRSLLPASSGRGPKGSTAVELPLAITILFLFAFFPLLNLGTLALRTSGVYNAARDAARVAARCKTFSQSQDPASPPAIAAAKDQAVSSARKIPGVMVSRNDVDVSIIAIPKNGGPVIRQSAPIASVDSQYLYQIEVHVKATVSPMVPMQMPFAHVPGLTDPAPIEAFSQQYAEHPSGMTK